MYTCAWNLHVHVHEHVHVHVPLEEESYWVIEFESMSREYSFHKP